MTLNRTWPEHSEDVAYMHTKNERTLPLSPAKGAKYRKTADFRLKSHFAWRKPATKFFCVKTVSDKVIV